MAMQHDGLDHHVLDPLLIEVVKEHQDKVVGWMRREPGCWGFLAGKAVVSCRQAMGRPLEDGERRLVWHRLWWLLERIKEGQAPES